jgi:hypothetical protein
MMTSCISVFRFFYFVFGACMAFLYVIGQKIFLTRGTETHPGALWLSFIFIALINLLMVMQMKKKDQRDRGRAAGLVFMAFFAGPVCWCLHQGFELNDVNFNYYTGWLVAAMIAFVPFYRFGLKLYFGLVSRDVNQICP